MTLRPVRPEPCTAHRVVTRERYGALPDGAGVDVFTLANAAGVEVRAITFGGIITSIVTPDRDGAPGDIVLGHDSLGPYLDQTTYFGALVGRHANRIARARFPLDGREYGLTPNEGVNHLHGGAQGFDKRVWDAALVRTPGGEGVAFSRISPAGEEGYPGTLRVRVQYVLSGGNELQVDYDAETDAPTVANLTQHSYFNLACERADDVLGHVLMLHADAYTPVDADQIPTGAIDAVDGTPFDFRAPAPIGRRIDEPDPQLRHGGGYDHNWVLRRSEAGLAPAASVVEPLSGRTLEVYTTEPGIQFYAGNRLDGSIRGKGGRRYGVRAGLCLATQGFPDGPNQPAFPSPVLRPGQRLRSRTIFRFGCVGGA